MASIEIIAKTAVLIGAGLVVLYSFWHIYKSNMFGNRRLNQDVKKAEPSEWSDENVTVSWLGHASVLMNMYGKKIIIDPALEDRIGVTPFSNRTVGPKRFLPPGLRADEVGKIDIILISHAHTDHFDYPTMRKLQSKDTIVIAAKGMSKFLGKMEFKEVIEIGWGEKAEVEGVEFRALEGRHWGERLPWHKDLDANSYLISKSGVNVFFGGDTAYTNKFAKQLYGVPVDVAFLGIGAYSPKSFQNRHASPEQAWKMAEEMGAQWVVPIHWGAFKLSQEPMLEPIKRFGEAAGDEAGRVAIWDVGGSFTIPAQK